MPCFNDGFVNELCQINLRLVLALNCKAWDTNDVTLVLLDSCTVTSISLGEAIVYEVVGNVAFKR